MLISKIRELDKLLKDNRKLMIVEPEGNLGWKRSVMGIEHKVKQMAQALIAVDDVLKSQLAQDMLTAGGEDCEAANNYLKGYIAAMTKIRKAIEATGGGDGYK